MRSPVQFPRPTEGEATRWQILRERIRARLARLANRIGLPGAIADVEIDDEATGQTIRIETGVFFTRLSVNGRDFYFRRFSGRFGGTGTGYLSRPGGCSLVATPGSASSPSRPRLKSPHQPIGAGSRA